MININSEAPIKCSKTITIKADSLRVWKVLTNIDNWPTWQTDISKSKLNGELKPEATFNWKSNGAKINSIIHIVKHNSKFGWTGKSLGIYAIHNWALSEVNGITTISVEESMEGFLASLFKKSFNQNLEKGMTKWLNLLKQECEK